MKKSKHYVDNKLFYEALVDYRAECDEAERISNSGDVTYPRVPDYVAECIMAIVNGMSKRPQFNGYPYLIDMVGDAIENCIRYVKSFKPEKSSNPFAYFSQITYYAFIRKINAEKKNLYVKFKMTDIVNITNMGAEHHASGMGPEENFALIKHSDYTQGEIDSFVEQFERSNFKKHKRRKDGA